MRSIRISSVPPGSARTLPPPGPRDDRDLGVGKRFDLHIRPTVLVGFQCGKKTVRSSVACGLLACLEHAALSLVLDDGFERSANLGKRRFHLRYVRERSRSWGMDIVD